MNKQKWLDIAEIMDAWRVVPRIVLFSTLVWAGALIASMVHWYFGLPGSERSLEASGFMSINIPAIVGIARLVIKDYVSGGRDWSSTASGEDK